MNQVYRIAHQEMIKERERLFAKRKKYQQKIYQHMNGYDKNNNIFQVINQIYQSIKKDNKKSTQEIETYQKLLVIKGYISKFEGQFKDLEQQFNSLTQSLKELELEQRMKNQEIKNLEKDIQLLENEKQQLNEKIKRIQNNQNYDISFQSEFCQELIELKNSMAASFNNSIFNQIIQFISNQLIFNKETIQHNFKYMLKLIYQLYKKYNDQYNKFQNKLFQRMYRIRQLFQQSSILYFDSPTLENLQKQIELLINKIKIDYSSTIANNNLIQLQKQEIQEGIIIFHNFLKNQIIKNVEAKQITEYYIYRHKQIFSQIMNQNFQ